MPTTDQPAEAVRPILAIDTSSAQGGVALYDGETLSARTWPAGRSHTATLLCEIHHLLDTAGQDVKQLAAIALATGPGTFTGLRAGFGLAKGFHLATDVPLLGIPTLRVAALPFAACAPRVVATVAAGRGRLVWAEFTSSSSELCEVAPPRNGTIGDLAASLRERGPCLVTGELDDEQERSLRELDGVVIPTRALRVRQPGALAALAWGRWQRGERDDPAMLEPAYLSR